VVTERALNKYGESTANRFSCKIRNHMPALIPNRWLGAERARGDAYPATDIEAEFYTMFRPQAREILIGDSKTLGEPKPAQCLVANAYAREREVPAINRILCR